MWTRRELKERAKGVLRNSYWRALIVSFIIVIAGGSFVSHGNFDNSDNERSSSKNISYAVNSNIENFEKNFRSSSRQLEAVGRDVSAAVQSMRLPGGNKGLFNSVFNGMFGILSNPIFFIMGIASVLLIVVVALALMFFRILVGYNLEVGGRRYFLMAAQGDESLSHTFDNIRSRYYVNIICTMFLRSLYTFLWSLLFVIPGIVKSYSYRMLPYILAENPDMLPSEAIALSRRMTDGHKMNMFVLDLSFIGWYFLGSLAFGIGRFFVNPYLESTYAQLYLTLSDRGGTYYTDEEDYIDVRATN